MQFYIDFNTIINDYVLKTIGAIEKHTDTGESMGYYIDINDLEQLGQLEIKIRTLTSAFHSLIVSINDRTIYIDKNI